MAEKSNRSGRSLPGRTAGQTASPLRGDAQKNHLQRGKSEDDERGGIDRLETQAVTSKPRPNPRIRRFLTTVHSRSQHVLHRPHLGYRGSHWGHSTRVRNSLATVLATEELPPPTPQAPAEVRVFAPLGTTALLENLAREQRMEVPHRPRSPHTSKR